MLSSIHPLGERVRHNRYAVTAAAFVAGGVAGGALLGAVAGLLALLAREALGDGAAVAWAIAAFATVAVLFEARVGGLVLPKAKRQVNEDWLQSYRGAVYGFGFGFQLGTGVATVVVTAALYAAIGVAIVSGSFAAAMMIGTTFGFVRGLTLLAGARLVDPESLRRFHHRLAETAPAAGTLATVSLAGVAVAAVLAGVTA